MLKQANSRPAARWRSSRACPFALAAALLGSGTVEAGERTFGDIYVEWFGYVEAEGTAFFEEATFDAQSRGTASVATEPSLLVEWNDGDTAAEATLFARYDSADERRTHFDVRELKIDHVSGPWSFTFGVDRLFWGRTEAFHLVDIINQTDLIENIDEETTLGQPLLRIGRQLGSGELAFFYLPYFRERTFPGTDGRLRIAPAVETSNPLYETSAEEWTPSFAVRYAGFLGPVDVGFSAFHGLSRDPSFFFDPSDGTLRPVYSRITQGSIDAQYTSGATLWKFEGLLRAGQRDLNFEERFYGATTGGIEYTVFGLGGGNGDLGLIAEYAWDSRGDEALTTFDNDAIAGLRFTFNDTQDTALLFSAAVDVTDGSTGLRLEAERRLTQSLTAEIEAQGFVNSETTTGVETITNDSFFRLRLRYFF